MGGYWIYVYLKASWEADAPKDPDALIDAYPVASHRAGRKEVGIRRRRGYIAELHWVYADLRREDVLR